MRHYIIISILILLSSQTAIGTPLTTSDSTSVQKIGKNSITLSTGMLPFQYGKTMLNYERVLCQSARRKNVGLGIITGIGKFSTPKYDGVVINPALVFFAGGEKRYFDLSAGINIFLMEYNEDNKIYYPSFNIGVRRIWKYTGFMYRIGTGYPEALNVGIGLRF